jgi:hypothetical protein
MTRLGTAKMIGAVNSAATNLPAYPNKTYFQLKFTTFYSLDLTDLAH